MLANSAPVNELEKEFRDLVNTIGKDIKSKVDIATALLNEAATLSDIHGIPFTYSNLHEELTYVPSSYRRKFSRIDESSISELSNIAKNIKSYDDNYEDQWLNSSLDCM